MDPNTPDQPNVTSRLGTCEVCEANEAKYKCPACDILSCSLPCVTTHKKNNNCDGKRNRTKFKPAKDLNVTDLQSDYSLILECARAVEGATTRRRDLERQRRASQRKRERTRRQQKQLPTKAAEES